MILNLGGEDVTVLTPTPRTVHTIAPLEPLPNGESAMTAESAARSGFRLFLPPGDAIARSARVRVRGATHVVEGDPALWADFVIAQVFRVGTDAVVTLRRPSTSSWDADDRATVFTPGATYATGVAARIENRAVRSTRDAETAEETLPVSPYVVELVDFDADVIEGDAMHIESADDASLTGRVLRVDHVERGGDQAGRGLLCSMVELPSTS